MVTLAALTSLTILATIGVGHLMLGIHVARRIAGRRTRYTDADPSPRAVVVLSLRGRDPFLEETIRALASQDYPHYSLSVIVDSEEDPAWEVVGRAAAEDRDVEIVVAPLRHRLESCGLKCSALVQALTAVPDEVEVVALADSDIRPDSRWLRRLVAPLSEPTVGVATGSQWFSPSRPTGGAILRSLWNAGSLVSMIVLGNVWAGSCALRMADVRRSGLMDRWRTSMVDDGPILVAMKQMKLETEFVGELISVNRETCDLRFTLQYVARMLTWSRVYEDTFRGTVVHMIVVSGSIALSTGLLIGALWLQDWPAAIWCSLGLALAWAALALTFFVVETGVARVVRRRDEQLAGRSLPRVLETVLLIPAALIVYTVSTVRAVFATRVTWRQVTYEVLGRSQVRILEDRPFVAGSRRPSAPADGASL